METKTSCSDIYNRGCTNTRPDGFITPRWIWTRNGKWVCTECRQSQNTQLENLVALVRATNIGTKLAKVSDVPGLKINLPEATWTETDPSPLLIGEFCSGRGDVLGVFDKTDFFQLEDMVAHVHTNATSDHHYYCD